jgi:hypothetical protein
MLISFELTDRFELRTDDATISSCELPFQLAQGNVSGVASSNAISSRLLEFLLWLRFSC